MNTAATEQIWEDFGDGIWRYARARVANDADADDVTQEVFLKVHRKSDQLRDDERVAGWLFRIASTTVADHHRRRARRGEERIPSEAVSEKLQEAPPGEVDDEQLLAACVRPFVEQLPEPYRQALIWVEFDGLTQVEAAERAGISVSGMKSRVQRGRAKLRDELETCCAIELDVRNGVMDVEPRCGENCAPS